MVKLSKVEQLENLNLEKEVKDLAKSYINILNDSYGDNRDIEKNLGGYVLLIQCEEDVQVVRSKILKGILPEYGESITVTNSKEYVLNMFILSSDYSVVVIATKKLTKLLLENK